MAAKRVAFFRRSLHWPEYQLGAVDRATRARAHSEDPRDRWSAEAKG
jgi:hypothetical protein